MRPSFQPSCLMQSIVRPALLCSHPVVYLSQLEGEAATSLRSRVPTVIPCSLNAPGGPWRTLCLCWRERRKEGSRKAKHRTSHAPLDARSRTCAASCGRIVAQEMSGRGRSGSGGRGRGRGGGGGGRGGSSSGGKGRGGRGGGGGGGPSTSSSGGRGGPPPSSSSQSSGGGGRGRGGGGGGRSSRRNRGRGAGRGKVDVEQERKRKEEEAARKQKEEAEAKRAAEKAAAEQQRKDEIARREKLQSDYESSIKAGIATLEAATNAVDLHAKLRGQLDPHKPGGAAASPLDTARETFESSKKKLKSDLKKCTAFVKKVKSGGVPDAKGVGGDEPPDQDAESDAVRGGGGRGAVGADREGETGG